jgi:hypothetical protein
MKRTALGIALASLAMYVWGFLFWGLSGLGYKSWKATTHDPAAQRALLDHFPESGTYYVPAMSHDRRELETLFSNGPVAFVHLIREGRPLADPSIMIQGFVLYLGVATLMAAILRKAGPALAGSRERFTQLLLVGIFAALLVDVGDAVWWKIPWAWKLTQAGYNIVAVAVGSAVLVRFVDGSTTTAAPKPSKPVA